MIFNGAVINLHVLSVNVYFFAVCVFHFLLFPSNILVWLFLSWLQDSEFWNTTQRGFSVFSGGGAQQLRQSQRVPVDR